MRPGPAGLDLPRAERWAEVALRNVTQAYPYKLDQVLNGDSDVQLPRAVHPAFWGSYDWHSCVHMHWTLARLLRRFPDHRLASATEDHLAARLTEASIAGELMALGRPGHAAFERPYGWAWLLKLATELGQLARERRAAQAPARAVAPLAEAIADLFADYLPRIDYPTRAGTHANTAFALLLALDYAELRRHRALVELIGHRARHWFGRDRRYPADYEPGGEDFLSPGLVESALMRRTMGSAPFADWWARFEPEPSALANWLSPVRVSDDSDARIVHLHGLNLSRSWCWRQLQPDLPAALAQPVQEAIDAHLASSLPAASDGEYVGTHWLASFAVLALDGS